MFWETVNTRRWMKMSESLPGLAGRLGREEPQTLAVQAVVSHLDALSSRRQDN